MMHGPTNTKLLVIFGMSLTFMSVVSVSAVLNEGASYEDV